MSQGESSIVRVRGRFVDNADIIALSDAMMFAMLQANILCVFFLLETSRLLFM